MISRYVVADPSALQAHVDEITGHWVEMDEAHRLPGGPATPPLTRRGTTNRNARGGTDDWRRREWLVATYRADKDVVAIDLFHGPLVVEVAPGTEGARPACRCYRCGVLLTVDTVTVDTVTVDRIRPACGSCNSETGGRLRSGT